MDDIPNLIKHWPCAVKTHFPRQHTRPGRNAVMFLLVLASFLLLVTCCNVIWYRLVSCDSKLEAVERLSIELVQPMEHDSNMVCCHFRASGHNKANALSCKNYHCNAHCRYGQVVVGGLQNVLVLTLLGTMTPPPVDQHVRNVLNTQTCVNFKNDSTHVCVCMSHLMDHMPIEPEMQCCGNVVIWWWWWCGDVVMWWDDVMMVVIGFLHLLKSEQRSLDF